MSPEYRLIDVPNEMRKSEWNGLFGEMLWSLLIALSAKMVSALSSAAAFALTLHKAQRPPLDVEWGREVKQIVF